MATVKLGEMSVKSTFYIKESGVNQEYIVIKHNAYGTTGTLVMRKKLPATAVYGPSNANYSGSNQDTYCNSTHLALFSSTVQSAAMTVTIPCNTKTGTESSAYTLSRKGFLLSATELGAGNLTVSHTRYLPSAGDGEWISDVFVDNDSRATTSDDGTNAYYRTRTPQKGGTTTQIWHIASTGGFSRAAATDGYKMRPCYVFPSNTLVVDSVYTGLTNTAPTVPGSISYSSPEAGKQMTVSWEASTDAEGNAITYTVERQLDSGSFVQVGQTTGLTMPVLVPSDQGATTITIRVKAADSLGLESAYRTGSALTISYNHTPTISGIDGSLGACTTAPTYTYTVDDEDAGDVLTVEESIETADGLTETLRTFTATRNQQYTVKWNCRCWLVCKPGTNKLIIRVTDSKGSSATRTMTFNRPVGCVSAARAVSTDAMPAKVLLSLYPSPAELPGDCTIEAYVTNNPFDDSPVWEDVSGKLNMTVHTFSNSTAANGYGLGYKFCITRDVETVEFYQAVLRFA
jgi:hypothetical protein